MRATASSPQAPAAGRLPGREIFTFCLAAIPTGALTTVVTVYLPKHYAGHVGIPLAVVGASFALCRLLDIAFDFLAGALMDRTRTRIGRFKPWLIGAIPVAMLSVYMLFYVTPGATQGYLITWLLVYYAAFSVLVLGSASYAATLATSYNDRSRLFAWSQVVGVGGSAVVLAVPFFAARLGYAGEVNAVHAMAGFLLVALPLGIGLMGLFTPERVAPETTREKFDLGELWALVARPAMVRLILADLLLAVTYFTNKTLYLFFFHSARGFSLTEANSLLVVQIVCGLVGAPAAAWLATRIGKHRALIATALGFVATEVYLWFTPNGNILYAAVGVFAMGALMSSFILLVRAMTADVGDEVRLEQGRERLGMLFALVTTTQKLGSAAAVAGTFAVLGLIGFKAAEGAVNTPEVLFGLELCYLGLPSVAAFAAAAALMGYKLDARRHGEIRKALDERDARLRAEAAATAPSLGPIHGVPAKP